MFGSPHSYGRDSEGFINLRYARDLSASNRLSARAYYGNYDYLGHWPIEGEAGPQNEHSVSRATWAGAELRLETLVGKDLRIVSGVDHQRNMRLDLWDFVEPAYALWSRARHKESRTSAYVQADYDLVSSLTLTGGARIDHQSAADTEISPRLGLIYKPGPGTAWKLLYGGGARAASPYERLWSADGRPLPSEKVRNAELTLEHYFAPRTRGVMSLFSYRVRNVIKTVEDPESGVNYFDNTGTARGRGIEFEIEHIADAGTHLRASLGYSAVRIESLDRATNSPRWLLKGSVAQPLPWFGLQAGIEGQWTSAQYSYMGRAASIGLANLTLSRPVGNDGWEVGASAYNLFDRRYDDPLPGDTGTLTSGVIPQGGRKFRVTVTRRF